MEFSYDNALRAISYEFDQLALGKRAFQPAGNGDFLIDQPYEQLLQIHALRKLLMQQQIIQGDPTSDVKRLKQLVINQVKQNELFEVWAEDIMADHVDNSIIRPAQLSTDILKKIIRHVCETRPIFLVFDTCELLSEELDRWLRVLLSDLITTGVPLLVLVGSRLKPDSHLDYGIANTWLQQVESEKRT
uniref:Uncharacterized protein n=1 Tax=Candidatus Kentrum sp. TUN TaxID=2126343 RepID=A0A451A496_9GAMM|nr:MAG: hypothetical protein BECKTUN1418D_GA0071000_11388 [Candidatus Kentron sp. TUN]